ncbi:MAG: glycosyltransferase [Desulfovibrio sp.]|nr:glycosyltransferase [Desulfovibrio sp.]
MPTPLISVIVNCFNSSQHLKACLDSLFQQSYSNFEVIFYDNGSTDCSASIAKSYGEKVRYFYGQQTVPLGCARNLALQKAQGELLAFLDCDDLWGKEKLAKQSALFALDKKIGLVCTDTILFDGKKELGRVFAQSKPAKGFVFRELLSRQWISMSSAMVSRQALASLNQDSSSWNGGWFDERLNVCEEADVFYRIAHDWKLDYVDEPLTFWRIHGLNTTFQKYGQFAEETLLILEKHRSLYPNYDQKYADLVQLLQNRATFQKAVHTWHNGNGPLARKLLTQLPHPSPKSRLFFFCTYLPGSIFPIMAKLYFALPKFLRSL